MAVSVRILFFVALTIQASAQSGLRFPVEYIDFTLDSNYFSVNGKYTFVNSSNAPVQNRITYPFPDNINEISDIRIINISKMHAAPFASKENCVQFDVHLDAMDTAEISVSYKQKTRAVNTYILKSTRFWNAPLDFAEYALTVKSPVRIAHFSYEPDRKATNGIETIYYWSKKRFFPSEDFIVTVDRK